MQQKKVIEDYLCSSLFSSNLYGYKLWRFTLYSEHRSCSFLISKCKVKTDREKMVTGSMESDFLHGYAVPTAETYTREEEII